MVKWSRWESNPRPLECHAVHGGPQRTRPCASVQEFWGSTPASQTVADGRAPSDRPRTAPVEAFEPKLRRYAPGRLGGPKKAILAVAASMLGACYYMLRDG